MRRFIREKSVMCVKIVSCVKVRKSALGLNLTGDPRVR